MSTKHEVIPGLGFIRITWSGLACLHIPRYWYWNMS